ncbi:uncharacterized protein V1510DRAFT_448335 [Dipodascopsis tothii]|uniref:uncharacterized protein n=1 Tax=Dipodascopsis tothii TaxID=44089 RepID=UPI0034CEC8CE
MSCRIRKFSHRNVSQQHRRPPTSSSTGRRTRVPFLLRAYDPASLAVAIAGVGVVVTVPGADGGAHGGAGAGPACVVLAAVAVDVPVTVGRTVGRHLSDVVARRRAPAGAAAAVVAGDAQTQAGVGAVVGAVVAGRPPDARIAAVQGAGAGGPPTPPPAHGGRHAVTAAAAVDDALHHAGRLAAGAGHAHAAVRGRLPLLGLVAVGLAVGLALGLVRLLGVGHPVVVRGLCVGRGRRHRRDAEARPAAGRHMDSAPPARHGRHRAVSGGITQHGSDPVAAFIDSRVHPPDQRPGFATGPPAATARAHPAGKMMAKDGGGTSVLGSASAPQSKYLSNHLHRHFILTSAFRTADQEAPTAKGAASAAVEDEEYSTDFSPEAATRQFSTTRFVTPAAAPVDRDGPVQARVQRQYQRQYQALEQRQGRFMRRAEEASPLSPETLVPCVPPKPFDANKGYLLPMHFLDEANSDEWLVQYLNGRASAAPAAPAIKRTPTVVADVLDDDRDLLDPEYTRRVARLLRTSLVQTRIDGRDSEFWYRYLLSLAYDDVAKAAADAALDEPDACANFYYNNNLVQPASLISALTEPNNTSEGVPGAPTQPEEESYKDRAVRRLKAIMAHLETQDGDADQELDLAKIREVIEQLE